MRRYFLILCMMMILTGCSLRVEDSGQVQESLLEAESIPEAESTLNTEEVQSTQESSVTESEPETETTIMMEPSDDELVRILDYIPDIVIDLKYATTDNFTGVVIYESDEAYLRYGTVKKLMQVQEAVKERGYSLLIWDAYRPVKAQFKLWEICPDSTYVANPNKGYSKHSRGNTVDIALIGLDGELAELPSGFDEFSKLADRDYSDVLEAAGANSAWLEKLMTEAGFTGYSKEWWHYSDTTDYPVVE